MRAEMTTSKRIQRNAQIEERFWSRVYKTADCWLWLRADHNNKGYGRIDVGGKRWLAHRFAYFLTFGPFDEDLVAHHTCENTKCVNPYHLELVTSEIHDKYLSDHGRYNREKTHCPRGHEYTPENTRLSQGNRRCCKLCNSPGTGLKGENNAHSKMTDHKVSEARKLRAQGALVKDLKDKYGVSQSVMSRALSGKTWSHVS